MKTMFLSTVIAFLMTSPVDAVPITWIFRGTTGPNSEFPGPPSVPIKEGLGFEMRIFLDTTTLGEPLGGGLAEVSFGSASGGINIETFSFLPVHFGLVEYFVTNGAVTGIVLTEPGFSDIGFDSPLTTETIVLRPIAPTEPTADDLLDEILGPNSLYVLRDTKVATFSAVLVPEGGSTALFLASALSVLGLLRWRYKGSVS